MLPEALICVVADKLPPLMLPVATTCPGELMLPEVILPDTDSVPSVPTVVKLLVTTFELRVLPVISAAAATDTTPVSCEPLPKKNCPAVMLPVALIAALAISVPLTVAPTAVTTTTLDMPPDDMITCASSSTVTLLVPFEIPLTPPAANS